MNAARLDQLRNQARPAGLVAGAYAAAGVSMEIFVEQKVIAEMRVLLQFFVLTEKRPVSGAVPQEDAAEPGPELGGHLVDAHEFSGAGGALHPKVVAVVVVKLLQRLYDQVIYRKPDGTAPVGVPSEHARGRFA